MNETFPKDLIGNLSPFCTRPMTMQRDIIGSQMFWHLNGSRFVSLPFDGKSRELFVEKRGMKEAYERLAGIIKDQASLESHLRRYQRACKRLIEASLVAAREKSGSSFKSFVKAVDDFGEFLIMPFAIEECIDPSLRKLVDERVMQAISSPGRINEYQRMRLAICDAAMGKGLDIAALADEFGWYNEYSYVEPLLDEAFFSSEIRKLSAEGVGKERDAIKKTVRQNKEAYARIIAAIKDPVAQLYARVIHEYAFIRTERLDMLKRAQVNIRALFRHISEKAKIPYEYVPAMTNEEIVAYLERGVLPDSALLKRRVEHKYVLYYDGRPHIIYENYDAVVSSVSRGGSDEVRGLVAYKGNISGRVSVVLSKDDFGKVKVGDVLVAKTTMPDYAPIMHKACAFVTDEGGVTSHAAITARELKKPCITGTKIATKAFKDGDLVEVDAEKGVVRKIE